MTQHILFKAADLHLAVPSRYIKAVHESLPVQPIDGTKDWFLGLSVANGKLLAVTDLGAFSGASISQGRTLELDPAVALVALKVDDVAGLSDVQAHDTGVCPSNVVLMEESSKLIGKLTGKSVSDKGAEHLILDLHALVQSSAFVNIKES